MISDDVNFKRLLTLVIILVCLIACILPGFMPGISEETAFGLSLLKEVSLGWVTGILFYYFGDFFKQKNPQKRHTGDTENV